MLSCRAKGDKNGSHAVRQNEIKMGHLLSEYVTQVCILPPKISNTN